MSKIHLALVPFEHLGPNDEGILKTLQLSQLMSANRHVGQPENCLRMYTEKATMGKKKPQRTSWAICLPVKGILLYGGKKKKKVSIKIIILSLLRPFFIQTNITVSCCEIG